MSLKNVNAELKTTKLNETVLQNLITLGLLVLISIIITAISPRFLSFTNINNVLLQISLIIIVGSGITLLMISGNFDLSVGGVLALAGVFFAVLCRSGVPTFIAIILAVLFGSLMGALNGVLVVNLKISPIIVTLGTMYITRGLALIFAKGSMISSGLPGDFRKLSNTYFGPISLVIIIVIAVVAIFFFIQSKTNLGQYAYFIGSNRETARLSGVNIGSTVSILYILVGTLAGLSGVILASKLGTGDSSVGDGFEFDTIVAAVIGGTSVAGGKGSISGLVLGAMILGVLNNSLNLLGVASYFQLVIKGLVLVFAIVLQRFIMEKFSN